MGWLSDDDYDLYVTRRDGRDIRRDREPRPVRERFNPDNHEQLEETVGRHFVPMAAAAEGVDIPPTHQRLSELDWLDNYQIEVWRTDGRLREPQVVSTATGRWDRR